jgi:phosphoribosylpyrophosphate synthetase
MPIGSYYWFNNCLTTENAKLSMNTTFTHLTKDERLMQKEMIQMYHDGKQNDAVRQNLISKDIAPDRAAYLAEKFREDYEFLIEEKRRKASQNSEITMITGWVLLIGGVRTCLKIK